jgi:hypothetical protein
MTLDVGEFIRRFLIHVLPGRFHRIGHYGLFANANRANNIALARQLLGVPGPVERRERRHRKSSRRPRVERLPLLRRAYDHHRDLRTRLPAAVVAHPIDRARQLMTSTLPSPSRIAGPVPRRYHTGDGDPLPTQSVSAAFDRHNAHPLPQGYDSDPRTPRPKPMAG